MNDNKMNNYKNNKNEYKINAITNVKLNDFSPRVNLKVLLLKLNC